MQFLYSELLDPIIVGIVLTLFTYWLNNRNK
ncbi:type I toxin-antitoxin system Fst family toxin [Latilactobacillus sakei]|nr:MULTISPECIES: type I toxin-antitoxin system Fst family toxin [Latilactobacillus]MCP8856549.1 type I toxin-antitoxin system Fst family toxin [Latilactobacillus sakei]MCP8856577.1 type I toxin-antitoxin system Fst family toxin [Latilactobacillus sakei]